MSMRERTYGPAMDIANREQLMEIVRDFVAKQGLQVTAESIRQAHAGAPDGWLVTNDNMALFRQYRNGVSPNPLDMIDEALDLHEEEV